MIVNVEALLREALAPIEPPVRVAQQFEARLESLTELAQEELEGWELSAMRDPRNWVRPVIATGIVATAGATLVVLRVRSGHRARVRESQTLIELAERTLKDIARETRKVLPDR